VTLNGATYGAGQYIIVADSGTILSSPDLTTWNGQNSTVTQNLLQVAYGSGVFVGVGQSGTVLTSSDGTNWSQQLSGVTEDITNVIFSHDLFVALPLTSSPTVILTSYDGINWNAFQAVCPVPSGFLFANGNFAMVQTGRLATPLLEASGMTEQGFALKFLGPTGESYLLQSSQDLVNWSTLSSFTNSQNPVLLLDPAALDHQSDFYRIVPP
jgi:hypothetical protein